jgi:hypothetical protein
MARAEANEDVTSRCVRCTIRVSRSIKGQYGHTREHSVEVRSVRVRPKVEGCMLRVRLRVRSKLRLR